MVEWIDEMEFYALCEFFYFKVDILPPKELRRGKDNNKSVRSY